jgi:hypothetical protein
MSVATKEERIIAVLKAFKSNPDLSLCEAARIYKVSNTTLQRRLSGTLAKADTWSSLAHLTKAEEKVLVQYILQLDE